MITIISKKNFNSIFLISVLTILLVQLTHVYGGEIGTCGDGNSTISMKFVDERVAGHTTQTVQLDITNIDLSHGLTLIPRAPGGTLGSQTTQGFLFNATTTTSTEMIRSFDVFTCWQRSTNQIVARWEPNKYYNYGVVRGNGLYQITHSEKHKPYSLLCSMSFWSEKNQISPDFEHNIDFEGFDSSGKEVLCPTKVPLPAKILVPKIEIRSAKLSQPKNRNTGGARVQMSFIGNHMGGYTISLQNGPLAQAHSSYDGSFSPRFCSVRGNSTFAPIQLLDTGDVVVHLPHPVTSAVRCTFNYGNQGLKNVTAPVSLSVSFGQETVISNSLKWNLPPASVTGSISIPDGAKNPIVSLKSSPWATSSTPLHAASTSQLLTSTIKIQFSDNVNLSDLALEEQTVSAGSVRQANRNCKGIFATSHIKGNTLTLSDAILDRKNPVDSLECSFRFRSVATMLKPKAGKQGEIDRMLQVLIQIDGKRLTSAESLDSWSPIYLPSVGRFAFANTKSGGIDQDKVPIGNGFADIVDFNTGLPILSRAGRQITMVLSDQFNLIPTTMQDPRLVVGLVGEGSDKSLETFPQHIGCQLQPHSATSATSNTNSSQEGGALRNDQKETTLVPRFDPLTLTWTFSLKSLANKPRYSLQIVCSFSQRVLWWENQDKFNFVPEHGISAQIIDFVDKKRFTVSEPLVALFEHGVAKDNQQCKGSKTSKADPNLTYNGTPRVVSGNEKEQQGDQNVQNGQNNGQNKAQNIQNGQNNAPNSPFSPQSSSPWDGPAYYSVVTSATVRDSACGIENISLVGFEVKVSQSFTISATSLSRLEALTDISNRQTAFVKAELERALKFNATHLESDIVERGESGRPYVDFTSVSNASRERVSHERRPLGVIVPLPEIYSNLQNKDSETMSMGIQATVVESVFSATFVMYPPIPNSSLTALDLDLSKVSIANLEAPHVSYKSSRYTARLMEFGATKVELVPGKVTWIKPLGAGNLGYGYNVGSFYFKAPPDAVGEEIPIATLTRKQVKAPLLKLCVTSWDCQSGLCSHALCVKKQLITSPPFMQISQPNLEPEFSKVNAYYNGAWGLGLGWERRIRVVLGIAVAFFLF